MRHLMKILHVVLFVIVTMALVQAIGADERESVKTLHGRYRQSSDSTKRKDALLELSRKEPRTDEDVNELRGIFSKKDYDEQLFEAATESLKRVHDPKLAGHLIEILKDEKPNMDKAFNKDFQGRSESERRRRGTGVLFTITNLGHMKSHDAVPILKDYLKYPGFSYYASEALAAIGDKSASDELRERAAKGEDVNYAGQGSSEAMSVIRDLEDPSKKDKWPKIAKQIIHIRDRNAKPHLKRLFNHEVPDVRWEAADRFRAMVDERDIPTIIEMTKHWDSIIRAEGIHAMVNLASFEFRDELVALLNDSAHNVRRETAKAIGMKKIVRLVPTLESALRDCDHRASNYATGSSRYDDEKSVCDEVYIALYLLTNKKYDFKGRNETTEQKAAIRKGVVPPVDRAVQ